LIGLITGRTKNTYRILVRKRLENLKGIWEEKIRLTFVGIYDGAHFYLSNKTTVLWDLMPCGLVEVKSLWQCAAFS
jgi:hypothetical protein